MSGAVKRFTLPSSETNVSNLDVLGEEGKKNALEFLKRILKSGLRPVITGDLCRRMG